MKRLTIDVNEGGHSSISLTNIDTEESIVLRGKYSWEEYKKMCSIVSMSAIYVNWLGCKVNFEELSDLTVEELAEVCDMLNEKLLEKKQCMK